MNIKPKPDTEYIYNTDKRWSKETLDHIDTTPGMIVTNVQLDDRGIGYTFNIPGDKTTYYCYYGWAFVENTPENVKLLEEISAYRETIKCLNRLNRLTHKQLVWLFGGD